MPLDLDPIRARLTSVNQERWARNTQPAIDPRFPLGTFLANAPADIAALLAEVESLREERSLSVAMCPSCGEVTKCDEDRCCISCGRDLIILADRHSADLLIELTGENEALRDELKTVQGQLACFKEDLRHVQVTLDQLRYRIERRDIY